MVVEDLFFATRIAATAQALGIAIERADLRSAAEHCRSASPDLVILDLQYPGDPLALARELKSDPATRDIPIVGFYPHVDQPLRRAALAAGVDQVLPRSAFTAKLAEILSPKP
jgi:CheY-like chemotaxis protein